MANHYRTGAAVRWAWGAGTGKGVIRDHFERRVQRTINGQRIVRNGTAANPAYVVELEDGGIVLKRGSELTAQ